MQEFSQAPRPVVDKDQISPIQFVLPIQISNIPVLEVRLAPSGISLAQTAFAHK